MFIDVDECANPTTCQNFETCINTNGSFQCVRQRSRCSEGHEMDYNSGQCIGELTHHGFFRYFSNNLT